MSIHIRPCAAGDEHALALVGQASFLETFAGILEGHDIVAHCVQQHSSEVYRAWLQDTSVKIWIAGVAPGEAPVGYLVLAPPSNLPGADPREDDLEVKRIYLLERYRGSGLGRRLMSEAIGEARRRGARRLLLGVYGRNETAIGFYERLGFVHAGVRRFRVGAATYDDVILALALA